MAREQPSVSCVCSEAGEGRPAPPKERSDPGNGRKEGVSRAKAKAPEWREKSGHKTAFPSEDQRDRERVRGEGRVLEQCPFSCRCSG